MVLALPAQPRGSSSRSRQQSTTQATAPVVGSSLANNYVVDVIVVDAGEGVGEKIQYYFQANRRFPSQFRGHSCLSVILSAQGAISCPRMKMRGSQVLFEGLYEIVRLSGFFLISSNGQAQLSGSLKLTFCDPDGGVFGGPVIGPLIAATPLQVAVLTFVHDA